MLKVILLLASILIVMLALACSSDDDSTNTPDPSATAQPSQTTHPVASLHKVAVDFFDAWMGTDFGTMAPLIDSEVGGASGTDFCRFAHANCRDEMIPSEWNESEVCVPGSYYAFEDIPNPLLPCFPREISNVSESPRDCRDATPAEAANGYGYHCLFLFSFAVRELGSQTEWDDLRFCVRVQQAGAAAVVLEAGTPVSLGALVGGYCEGVTP